MTGTNVLNLAGCRSTPLASYLKALGILRLVAEQRDTHARGRWNGDGFELRTSLNRDDLLAFFLNEYRPCAIVAPWNGGSGFYPKDNQDGLNAIAESSNPRFADYRMVLDACRRFVDERELKERPGADVKFEFLVRLRAVLPDCALPWLDASVQLTGDKLRFPPLLGTGGNDGRLDFTNNFMQRLASVLGLPGGSSPPESPSWLRAALLATAEPGMQSKAVGQFDPGNAGGANATVGFDGNALANPWDFVLMIEGALLFAGGTSRRMGMQERGELSYPFNVRCSAAGHGSSGLRDAGSCRAEQWVPLWDRFTSVREISQLFTEGRVRVGSRPAIRGSDFARALASLGVDRGLTSFQRFTFMERNGLAYLAVPMGHWPVSHNPQIDLLTQVDGWLDSLHRLAADDTAPSKFARVNQQVDRAIMKVCRSQGHFTDILVALGRAERAMTTSPKLACERPLRPLPPLGDQWLEAADDGTVEFRLAASLASVQGHGDVGNIRCHLTPHDRRRPYAPFTSPMMASKSLVASRADLTELLLAILDRRLLEASRGDSTQLPLAGRFPVSLDDVLAFIAGDIDDRRIAELLPGLAAIDWHESKFQGLQPQGTVRPLPSAYALLKLTHLPCRPDGRPVTVESPGIPLDGSILAAARAGRAPEACRRAAHRLQASGWRALTSSTTADGRAIRRIAAAVLFPLSSSDVRRVASLSLFPDAVGSLEHE